MSGKRRNRRRIYLDHNATTAVRREVLEAMLPYFRERHGNASSIHFYGQEGREAVDGAREAVAELIGARPDEVVFTSGGTESDNIAIRGSIKARGLDLRVPHVVTSTIEHPAVLNTCKGLENEGVEVTYIPCTADGVVRLDELEESLRPETILVSVMLANNETGVIQPVREISALTRERGINLHVDAIQGVGKISVNVDELGADMLSISAHKFYGPKGVGALYVKRGTRIEPVYAGGGHEFGMRPGTENVPAVVGLGESSRISRKSLKRDSEKLRRLRDRLEAGVLKSVEDVRVNGSEAPRLPNTSSIIVSRVEGEAITLNLSVLGIAISSGSACASGDIDPSHVLLAMGFDPADAQGGIRISLGIENTDEDIGAFLEIFPGVVERLRGLSPLKQSP